MITFLMLFGFAAVTASWMMRKGHQIVREILKDIIVPKWGCDA
jgi:hypothetical protein